MPPKARTAWQRTTKSLSASASNNGSTDASPIVTSAVPAVSRTVFDESRNNFINAGTAFSARILPRASAAALFTAPSRSRHAAIKASTVRASLMSPQAFAACSRTRQRSSFNA